MIIVKLLKFIFKIPAFIILIPILSIILVVEIIKEYNNNIEFSIEMEKEGFSDKISEEFKAMLLKAGIVQIIYTISIIGWLLILKQIILN